MKLAITLLALVLGIAPALAQTFPAKPVRLVIPTTPGGGLDLLGRIIAKQLAESWPQPVVVENRPGANFIVGTDFVAKAAADGHTLLIVASPALTINPFVLADLPYDPQRDIAPVNVIASSPFVLVVGTALPVANARELIEHLRANPGKLNLASHSTSTRLASELFKSLARLEYTDVNYKGGSASAASVAAGETQMSFLDLGSATAPLASGRVRALAMTTTERYRLNPDIPTLAEAGVPGYASVGWIVIAAPGRTPPDITAKVSADLTKIIAMPEVAKRIESVGSQVLGRTPEGSVALLREDAERWSRLVKERSIRFQ